MALLVVGPRELTLLRPGNGLESRQSVGEGLVFAFAERQDEHVPRAMITLVLLAGCGGSNVTPQALPEAELDVLEADVRQIAAAPCGSCHTSGLRTAKREALDVFDLADARWSRDLQPGQWDFFFDRIEGEVEPTDRATVLRFVAAAKAR